MALTYFEKVRSLGIKSLFPKSLKWYQEAIRKLQVPTRNSLLRDQRNTITKAFIGNLFLFFYDAKTKDDLPYWDKFPLVLPFGIYSDHFIGINFHYISVPMRAKLLDALLDYATNDRYDENTKILMTWNLLKNLSNHPEIKFMVKKYLWSEVRSSFLKVDSIDWLLACTLPVENFQKQSKYKVWKDARAAK